MEGLSLSVSFDFLDSAFQIHVFQKFDFSMLKSYGISYFISIALADDYANKSRIG